jgi:peptidoglycan/LPS O-acetylase OafA/YrhL
MAAVLPRVESARVLEAPVPVLSSRLKSIDLLRGCAALFVVIHHGFDRGLPFGPVPIWLRPLQAVFAQGYLGVPLFFVISGFCIHLPYARSALAGGTPHVGFVRFWKRRIHRLYPPYFFALCLSMLAVLVVYWRGMDSTVLAQYPFPRLRWIGIDFLAHVFMVHGLVPRLDQMAGNAAFWTLAREEYLYLLYFFVLGWRKRWGMGVAIGLVLTLGFAFHFALVPFVAAGSPWWAIIDTSAIVLWIQWCLGMVAVEAYYGLIKLPRWLSQLWVALPAAVAAKLSESYIPVLAPSLWALTFFVVVNYCVQRESAPLFSKPGIVGWLAGVGIFSYSLYLIHGPIQQVLFRIIYRLPIAVTPGIYLLFGVLVIIGSYYGSLAFFRVVEKRFLNTRSKAMAAVPSE